MAGKNIVNRHVNNDEHKFLHKNKMIDSKLFM